MVIRWSEVPSIGLELRGDWLPEQRIRGLWWDFEAASVDVYWFDSCLSVVDVDLTPPGTRAGVICGSRCPNVSFARSGLPHFLLPTHGLRFFDRLRASCGLYSNAASAAVTRGVPCWII